MIWERFIGKKEGNQSRVGQPNLVSPRFPDGSEAATEEKQTLCLLANLAPDAARVFEQLQDPHLSGEEFYEQLSLFNERERKDKFGKPTEVWRFEWATPADKCFTIERRIIPGRYIAVDFTSDGKVDIRGRDETYDRLNEGRFRGKPSFWNS